MELPSSELRVRRRLGKPALAIASNYVEPTSTLGHVAAAEYHGLRRPRTDVGELGSCLRPRGAARHG